MPWATAHFPDAIIWLLPVGTDMVNKRTHHRPEWTFQRFTIALKAAKATIQMDAVQHLAKHIQLFLLCRAIPNAHRAGACIAAQMRQLLLGQITFATDAVHDLQILAVGKRETTQPVDKGASLFCKTQDVERIERKSGIT